ncbi:TPA: molecular chaperone TorD [Vibrio cholerae]|uniref:molecular chaperone TorD n=1 Tax=Vibrio cholerae TaxID=666 RepID=UPI000157D826|nr:molecular chaperone TorD [Vibrio cholerae]EGR2446777.1 molecular chaperone TorD [Vibrio cholerae]EGR4062574.1 molecular chaperone TorD [Vibrio cholerae]EGR4281005.1 molecular chaperone TorD [Vibrio cholerae]EGR4421367.1 molecular chaperone TorD [Vibrio cholerae]EGR4432365.1 molecular chaperone TorD [Vibrio cholerae]
MMQELKILNEKRAEIYWWLSSLFFKELSEQDIARYHSAEVRTFLSGLADEQSLSREVKHLVEALNRLQDRQDAQLELAADFCDLFLKSDRDSALPYASVYTDQGLLNGKPAQQMRELLGAHGVKVEQNLNEPEDHLAIQLDFLAHLAISANQIEHSAQLSIALQAQSDFISQHLLTWLPAFAERCTQFDAFGLYSAAARLALAFIQQDKHCLDELIQETH